jgi:hypothetical protein
MSPTSTFSLVKASIGKVCPEISRKGMKTPKLHIALSTITQAPAHTSLPASCKFHQWRRYFALSIQKFTAFRGLKTTCWQFSNQKLWFNTYRIQFKLCQVPSPPTYWKQFYSTLKLEIFAGSFKLIEKDKRVLHFQANSFLLGLL